MQSKLGGRFSASLSVADEAQDDSKARGSQESSVFPVGDLPDLSQSNQSAKPTVLQFVYPRVIKERRN